MTHTTRRTSTNSLLKQGWDGQVLFTILPERQFSISIVWRRKQDQFWTRIPGYESMPMEHLRMWVYLFYSFKGPVTLLLLLFKGPGSLSSCLDIDRCQFVCYWIFETTIFAFPNCFLERLLYHQGCHAHARSLIVFPKCNLYFERYMGFHVRLHKWAWRSKRSTFPLSFKRITAETWRGDRRQHLWPYTRSMCIWYLVSTNGGWSSNTWSLNKNQLPKNCRFSKYSVLNPQTAHELFLRLGVLSQTLLCMER